MLRHTSNAVMTFAATQVRKCSLLSTAGALLSTALLTSIPQQVMANDAVCSPNSDQNFIDSCWYLGVGAGVSDITVNDDSEWSTTDSNDNAGYFAVGNRFKPNWFVELRLTDLGGAEVDPKDTADTRTDVVNYQMTDLSVGYTLFGAPEKTFNAYGKLGLGLLSNDVDNSEINITQEVTAEISAGVGVQARFADRYFARLEVNTYGEDIQAAFFSINRYFGKTEAEKNNL